MSIKLGGRGTKNEWSGGAGHKVKVVNHRILRLPWEGSEKKKKRALPPTKGLRSQKSGNVRVYNTNKVAQGPKVKAGPNLGGRDAGNCKKGTSMTDTTREQQARAETQKGDKTDY